MTDHNPYLINEHLSSGFGLLGFLKRNFVPNSRKALEAQSRNLDKQLHKKETQQEIDRKRAQLLGHGSGHSQLLPHMPS